MDNKAGSLFTAINHLGWEKIKSVSEDLSQVTLNLNIRQRGIKVAIARNGDEYVISFENPLQMLNRNFVKGSWLQCFGDILQKIKLLEEVVRREFYPIEQSSFQLIPDDDVLSCSLFVEPGSIMKLSLIFDGFWKVSPSVLFVDKWDPEANSLENLQNLFPNANQLHKDQLECCICSEIWLDRHSPSLSCPLCNSQYHKECAASWLQIDPDTRSVFGQLGGKCPVCCQGLLNIPVD